MAVYYSFHYDHDSWRVQQIAKMGAIEGQPILNSQEWEKVKRGGNAAIEKWIADQMSYKTAVVVLIGAETASRPWVRYEIVKAWNDRRPLVGVRIHSLAGRDGRADRMGVNPFSKISLNGGRTIADYVPVHDPSGINSQAVYRSISVNLKTWVSTAYKR